MDDHEDDYLTWLYTVHGGSEIICKRRGLVDDRGYLTPKGVEALKRWEASSLEAQLRMAARERETERRSGRNTKARRENAKKKKRERQARKKARR